MSNGKGSKPRPLSTSYEKYAENYDAIFRKKPMSNKAKARWKKSADNEGDIAIFTGGKIIKGDNGKVEVWDNGKITGAQG